MLCGAPASRCEAHHLLPWEAPAKGETNINNLALVCEDCHHHIHDSLLTLFWTLDDPDVNGHRKRRWHTRPATPDETPPPQPKQRAKPPRPSTSHASEPGRPSNKPNPPNNANEPGENRPTNPAVNREPKSKPTPTPPSGNHTRKGTVACARAG